MFRAGIFCGMPFGNAATRERKGKTEAVLSLTGRTKPDRKVKKMRVGSVRFGFCGTVRFKEE